MNGLETATIPGPRWSVGGLMSAIALIAVSLALIRFAPLIGIPLVLILLAAWARTHMITRRRLAAGLPLARKEWTGDFASSFVEVILLACNLVVVTACGVIGFYPFFLWLREWALIPAALLTLGVDVAFARWVLRGPRVTWDGEVLPAPGRRARR